MPCLKRACGRFLINKKDRQRYSTQENPFRYLLTIKDSKKAFKGILGLEKTLQDSSLTEEFLKDPFSGWRPLWKFFSLYKIPTERICFMEDFWRPLKGILGLVKTLQESSVMEEFLKEPFSERKPVWKFFSVCPLREFSLWKTFDFGLFFLSLHRRPFFSRLQKIPQKAYYSQKTFRKFSL